MKIKSCKLIFICIVVLTILFFALPGFPKDSTLQVKCVDSSGNPIRDVKIEIFSLNSQKTKDKKSDAEGNAEFKKLDDGIYRIIGRKDGFAPALYEFVLLQGSAESVVLKLAVGADKKLYFEDPAENGKAAEFAKQGFEAYKQKKFADAETLLRQSLEIDPSNIEALLYCGSSCLQQSKFDEGVKLLTKAAKIADILKTLASTAPQGQNPYERIYQSAQQLLNALPAIKGESALKQQKYDVAVAEFSDAIKNDPNNSDYYANLAVALTNLNKFDQAMAAVDKAIQLKPDENTYATLKSSITARMENAEIEKAQAVMNEGNKLLQDGDAAGAIQKFEEAKSMVALERQSPLWRQLARAQAKLNQSDAAIESFKKSIELAPADKVADYRNAFAQFYIDGKKYEEALDILADPSAAGSQRPEQALLDLAEAAKNKEPELAEAALERVIKADPENADVYFDLGVMYYADGKEKDSRTKELLTKFIEIGKDPAKIENAKNMIVLINRRSK